MGVSGERRHASPALLFSVLALLSAGLIVYSQTMAFAWDEGFHILTAQLIKHGKRPYIDFVFSQTPLNAYWNAAWMAVFGESWRVPHLMAALCSASAMILTGTFVLRRFPVPAWRVPGAMMAALWVGLNVAVVKYGAIAQPYGLCLLVAVAAYWFSIRCVERHGALCAGLAGLACGIAAASSLLTAPLGPVLLLWLLVNNRAGRRWVKLAAFLLGGAIACIPVLGLFVQGPRQVWFGIVQYNALYRQLDWSGAFEHNLEVLTYWIDSGPVLLLLLLSIGGLLYIRFCSNWDKHRKSEFYLCGWLSAAFAAYLSSVMPTFARYYIFEVPFLAILATAGIYAATSAIYRPDRPWLPLLTLAFLLTFGLGKTLYENRENMVWPDVEQIARKVNEVTPPQQRLLADEVVYFVTRREPPSGMEMENSHKFHFSSKQQAFLHLISQAELDRQVKAGVFSTVEACLDQDDLDERGYPKLYAKSDTIHSCTIFWNKK